MRLWPNVSVDLCTLTVPLTMRSLHLSAVALSFTVLPMMAHAQRQASTDSVPRTGEWAAELILGPSATGANLLRFTSPQFALVFGADFDVTHRKSESTTTAGVFSQSGTFSSVAARLGVRSLRQPPTERLRPVVGFGVRGTYSGGPSDFRAWQAGVYGELGAVYFIAPHVSLGGTGELRVSYGKQKQGSALSTGETTFTDVGGSIARLLLSVYF
jgi:hypothetical protein